MLTNASENCLSHKKMLHAYRAQGRWKTDKFYRVSYFNTHFNQKAFMNGNKRVVTCSQTALQGRGRALKALAFDSCLNCTATPPCRF